MLSKKYRKSVPIGKQSKKSVAKNFPLVLERDNHQCVVAGSVWAFKYPCAGGLTPQHAVRRGMGSSALYDGVDYLRAMCSFHNGLEMSRADFREACFRMGWSVQGWLADTEGITNIPVWYQDGWHLLNNGKRIPLTDEQAEQLWYDLEAE